MIRVNLIQNVAKDTGMPEWWVESIAIEYTDCREFAVEGKLWKFDFNKVSPEDLKSALETYKVVSRDNFIDNVHKSNFRPKLMMRMVSDAVPPLSYDIKSSVPDGPLSKNAFPFETNSLTIVDPKLGFSEYFQVFDEGRLWQWHFAEFVKVDERSYGKMISSEVNLDPVDQITTEYVKLLNEKFINPGETGYQEFLNDVKNFYKKVDEIKQPIFEELLKIHKEKKDSGNFPKEINYSPPLLSHFESFKIKDDDIHTNFLVEPIFFRECTNHTEKSKELTVQAKNDDELLKVLDNIYQARVTAIVLGTACLEAFIKNILSENFPEIFETVSRMGYDKQLELFYLLKSKDKPDFDRMPYQFLKDLNRRRNSIIHFKHQWREVLKSGRTSRTYINGNLLQDTFVHQIPGRIESLIKKICEDTDIDIPGWLNEKEFWMKL